MADFKTALALILKNEGGYGFDKDDPGGETYKGIARNMNGKWPGWVTIDLLKRDSKFPNTLENNTALQDSVAQFYEANYWNKVQGDTITSQLVANSIFDFAVNAGVGTSSSLAQLVVGAKADGVIGPASVAAINAFDAELFLASFTIAKISRYISIIEKRPLSRKYFYGWVRRAVGR
jgi:lysozyme family protein